MEISSLIKWIEELSLKEGIKIEDIPSIDLYMDQVSTLFEDKLQHTKRYETDKLLTKTMINNYTKDKLLMPSKKKKYTREHIILMSLIYQLKNVLSIGDIKQLLSPISQQEEVDKEELLRMYSIYLHSKEYALESFQKEVEELFTHLKEQLVQKEPGQKALEEESELLMAMLLVEKASYYKKLAEKIIDSKTIKKEPQN